MRLFISLLHKYRFQSLLPSLSGALAASCQCHPAETLRGAGQRPMGTGQAFWCHSSAMPSASVSHCPWHPAGSNPGRWGGHRSIPAPRLPPVTSAAPGQLVSLSPLSLALRLNHHNRIYGHGLESITWGWSHHALHTPPLIFPRRCGSLDPAPWEGTHCSGGTRGHSPAGGAMGQEGQSPVLRWLWCHRGQTGPGECGQGCGHGVLPITLPAWLRSDAAFPGVLLSCNASRSLGAFACGTAEN